MPETFNCIKLPVVYGADIQMHLSDQSVIIKPSELVLRVFDPTKFGRHIKHEPNMYLRPPCSN